MQPLKISQKEPEYKKVKRSLRYSIIDGSFFNLMDGFTASFIGPYALFLNASNIVLSLLSSLPDLFASFFQLSAIKVSEIFRSRKYIIVASAFMQSIIWLPILLIPYIIKKEEQGLYLILLIAVVTMLNSFISPLWRSMMGDLVAENERGLFFSKRNKIVAVVGFFSTFLAGWILQHFSNTSPLIGFSILFGVALFARFMSSVFLFLMYEKKAAPVQKSPFKKNSFTLMSFLRGITKSDYGKFVIFICLFRIAVSIAAPFFVVYEITYLHYSYLQFTILSATEILASVAFLGVWGRINDEKGSRMVIVLSGLLIPFVPMLYLVSPNFYFLLAVSVLSGAAWGGFNLAVGNFIFDASSSQDRVRYVSYFNLLHGISVFIGAMMGGLLLNMLPAVKGSLLALFMISGLGRLLIAAFMFPSLREMRVIQVKFDSKQLNYSLFIKPRQGFVEDPWDYYMAYEKRPANMPRLKMDPAILKQEEEYLDPEEKRKKDKLIQKNFMQSMVDNMKKKK